jgi:hypothetical protein
MRTRYGRPTAYRVSSGGRRRHVADDACEVSQGIRID